MTPNSLTSSAYALNFVSDGSGQRPWRNFSAPPQDDHAALTPDSDIAEATHLFDIDGLLKIVRLIEEIKKDGRLESAVEGQIDRGDTPCAC